MAACAGLETGPAATPVKEVGQHGKKNCANNQAVSDCVAKKSDTRGPVSRVVSKNLHRRHLTSAQLALCAARAREFYDLQAKERMRDAGAKGDRKSTRLNSSHLGISYA